MKNPPAHVILVAYNFPPDNAVGGARPFRFYRYLKELGYACTVFTASPQPNAPPDVISIPDRLADVWERKNRGPLSLGGHVERLIRRFVFPGAGGIVWSAEVARRSADVAGRNGRRRTVVLTSFPPVGVIGAGLLIAVRERLPWIADFRDPLPVAVGPQFYSPFNRRMYARLERRVFKSASAVIANVDEAAAVWRERYPWLERKLQVICNGYDPADLPRAEDTPPHEERVIVHAGELYEGRNPNAILWSLLRLRERGEPEALRTRVLLVGPVSNSAQIDPALREKMANSEWLELREPVPKKEALALTAQSDGLLLLQPQSTVQVPGKLFEYVSIGRPILALVPRGSAVERILSRAGVPYRCMYADDAPEAADRALLEYLKLDSKPVRFSAWFETHFDARKQTVELASIIEEILKG